MLWDNSIDLRIQSSSPYHIDAWVSKEGARAWRLTGFYGQWDAAKRHESWELLKLLGSRSDKPWLCCGDFNEILTHDEKKGGNRKPSSLLSNFREALVFCNLFDCGFEGYPFTWSNNQEVGLIEERIDRCCATPDWLQLFPSFSVKHAVATSSDHCPLILKCSERAFKPRRQKQFRFEAMWVRDGGCEKVIRDHWATSPGGNGLGNVSRSIAECGEALEQWDKSTFGKVHVEIKALRKKMRFLDRNKDRGGNRALLKETKERLDELFAREEIMWRQRSRVIWLQDGDKNTSFFHNSASDRKASNTINGIFYANRCWTSKQEEMLEVARDYFINIF